jgi:5,10-methylenetetrahydrofolate reductase
MTQPVYDPLKSSSAFSMPSRRSSMPVMVGILPLASSKNAEFLHAQRPRHAGAGRGNP